MRKKFQWIAIALLVLILVYNFWAAAGRAVDRKTGWVSMPLISTHFNIHSFGLDAKHGNILAIQPYMSTRSYSTSFNFFVTLKLYLLQAKQAGLLNSETIVVFPQHCGSWLFLANEKEGIFQDTVMSDALRLMQWSNCYKYCSHYLSAPSQQDKNISALISMKAAGAVKIYQDVFSQLSKEFAITIVAGSILLPKPALVKGTLTAGSGQLSNTTAVFDTSGHIISPLITQPFNKADGDGVKNDQPSGIYTVGKKRLVVAQDPANIMAELQQQNDSNTVWALPYAVPDARDWERFTETDTAKINEAGFTQHWPTQAAGIAVSFTGDIWNLYRKGPLIASLGDSLYQLPAGRAGRMANCWLP